MILSLEQAPRHRDGRWPIRIKALPVEQTVFAWQAGLDIVQSGVEVAGRITLPVGEALTAFGVGVAGEPARPASSQREAHDHRRGRRLAGRWLAPLSDMEEAEG